MEVAAPPRPRKGQVAPGAELGYAGTPSIPSAPHNCPGASPGPGSPIDVTPIPPLTQSVCAFNGAKARRYWRSRGADRNFSSKTETIASCPPNHHIHRPRRNRRGRTSRPRTWRGSATRSRCAGRRTRAGSATSNPRITASPRHRSPQTRCSRGYPPAVTVHRRIRTRWRVTNVNPQR